MRGRSANRFQTHNAFEDMRILFPDIRTDDIRQKPRRDTAGALFLRRLKRLRASSITQYLVSIARRANPIL